eukprot:3172662-Pleurochrysis_carterae.AAC.1
MRKDLAAASVKYNELAAQHKAAQDKISELQGKVLELQSELEDAKLMYDTSTEQLQEYTMKLTHAERRAAAAEQQYKELKEASRDVGGRPRGHAGREELKRRWSSMSGTARRSALCRHASDIKNALLDAGCEDWIPSCLALALQSLGLMDLLLRTKIVARQRLQLEHELAAILQAEWGIDLSLFVRNELNISDSEYDKLRLAFCKRYLLGNCRWVKRIWYQCPVLGKSVSIPKPLLSRYKLAGALQSYTEKHGLTLSVDGKVCERSLLESARHLIDRDRELLVDPERSPWLLTFGVDATAVSSKRQFTHALLSISGMYERSKATLSELKALTLAISQHKDNSEGLPKMLHHKESVEGKEGAGVVCLAAEIEQLYSTPQLQLTDGSSVACGLRCCLDLAAVRGMRGVGGKGAALCGCQGKEGRQKIPGEDGIPEVGNGGDLATWRESEIVLKEHCTFNSELMHYESVRSAAHIPPEDYDYTTPWHCPHCKKDVFSSRREFDDARAGLASLKASYLADDENKEAAAAYDKIMSDHSRTHLDQQLFMAPVLKVGTDIFIVDLLHCVQLNVAKTARKYSFADKLDERGRERATAYMESIGCYLDLRAKGQRNPENKFMTGATVDDYVMGRLRDPKSLSPGLAINTMAMCELTYGSKKAASADTEASAAAQPTRATTTTASRGGSRR